MRMILIGKRRVKKWNLKYAILIILVVLLSLRQQIKDLFQLARFVQAKPPPSLWTTIPQLPTLDLYLTLVYMISNDHPWQFFLLYNSNIRK